MIEKKNYIRKIRHVKTANTSKGRNNSLRKNIMNKVKNFEMKII